jgi:hypothetical protein
MKIAIIGNSHFGPILTKQLSEFDKNNSYSFYDTNGKKLDKIKFALNLPFTDIVYSLSASISGGGALKLALKFKKRIVQHFIGSDVLTAQEDLKNGKINYQLLNKSKFITVSPWLQDELKHLNIFADIYPHSIFETYAPIKDFYSLRVLTYQSKGKELFYGMSDLIKLALAFPSIEFRIAGIEKFDGLPTNIKCLGWINMLEELENSTLFLRNAEHDGLPFSVIESLGLGRSVFMRNANFPYVTNFKNYIDLKKKFSIFVEDFNANKIKVNYQAINFIKKEYSKNHVLGNLVKILTENGDK